jgi:hypothetical protein
VEYYYIDPITINKERYFYETDTMDEGRVGDDMIQIRRSIFETSSSSANAMVMVSDRTAGEAHRLEQPFDAVMGAYYIDYDGANHIYLADWRSKLNFFLGQCENSRMLERIVKKHTGQTFCVMRLWEKMDWYDQERYVREQQLQEGQEPMWLEADPQAFGWRIPEIRDSVDSNNRYCFLDGALCGYCSSYYEGIVAIPREIDAYEYGLMPIECKYIESGRLLNELFLQYGSHKPEIQELLEEVIFNDSIAINMGGDAFFYDMKRGIPGETLLPEDFHMQHPDSRDAFRMKTFSPAIVSACNGNELLWVGSDGTKMRICTENSPRPEYPDTIDLKVTDRCRNNCAFCYENSTPQGANGHLDYPFLKTIPRFVELAVGGGNPWSFPELERVTELTDIVNITLHENDWFRIMEHTCGDFEEAPLDKFRAIGISLTGEHTFDEIMKCYGYGSDKRPYRRYDALPHDQPVFVHHVWSDDCMECHDTELVFHIVYGVAGRELVESMYDKGVKLLILGFKSKGRGINFQNQERERLERNQKWLYENLEEAVRHFSVVSFDNLALEQLDVRRLVSESDWNRYFMGEDGTHSMYIDLVKGEFGISSTDERRWPVMDDIRDMFRVVREQRLYEQ